MILGAVNIEVRKPFHAAIENRKLAEDGRVSKPYNGLVLKKIKNKRKTLSPKLADVSPKVTANKKTSRPLCPSSQLGPATKILPFTRLTFHCDGLRDSFPEVEEMPDNQKRFHNTIQCVFLPGTSARRLSLGVQPRCSTKSIRAIMLAGRDDYCDRWRL